MSEFASIDENELRARTRALLDELHPEQTDAQTFRQARRERGPVQPFATGHLAQCRPHELLEGHHRGHRISRQPEHDRATAPFEASEGERVAGFDLFDNSGTLQKLYPKLISSYALDALDAQDSPFAVPGVAEAERLVSDGFEQTEMKKFPAVGEGTDVRITSSQVTGSALLASACPVHICGFYREADDHARGDTHRFARTDFPRASWRRQRRESRD